MNNYYLNNLPKKILIIAEVYLILSFMIGIFESAPSSLSE